MAAPVLNKVRFKCTILSGPLQNQQFDFHRDIVTVGRGPENDIVLAGDAKVSRQHAEFRYVNDSWCVVNISQKNFVLVDDQQVSKANISSSSKVQLGDSVFKLDLVVVPKEVETEPIQPPAPLVAMALPKPDLIPTATTSDLPGFQNSAPQVPSASSGVSNHFPASRHQQVQSASVNSGYPAHRPIPQQFGTPMGAPISGNANYSNPSIDDNSKRIRFYGIVAIVGLVLWFMFSGGNKGPKKDPNAIRTTDQIKLDVQTTEKAIGQLKEEEERRNSIQYKKSQENLVRGFRDFQQGQYARARDSFQVVLNLDPENELAQRYIQLSQIKIDQQVKELMLQGARYREKMNWRLCMDAFSKVMTTLQGRRDNPTYAEAQKYFEECRLEFEGKY